MKRYTFLLLAAILFVGACSKDDKLPTDPIIGLGGDTWAPTSIDTFIYQNFVKPYNIEVKYKWDPYELNFNRDMVPPDESVVLPVLNSVIEIWRKPYETVAGPNFLHRFALLKFAMIGSAEYQSDGTIILGNAEGGSRINLMIVNDFAYNKEDQVVRLLHTVHHEFAHILHQTIMYPEEWRGISTQWYTGTWFNTSIEDAQAQGMVTDYAKAAEEEDFVETVSFLLIEGQERFDQLKEDNPDVADIFTLKENIVVDYYKESLGIDFRKLQEEVKKGKELILAMGSDNSN
ncbi:substrate import-associated zinc metallohydrolase lipoprotein [bacterium A37T11]|nr:substrate import-associated zinc metallohydrolase lipoprotein [bacterium A37T11]